MCVSRICLIPEPVLFFTLLSKVLNQTQDPFVVNSGSRGREQAGKPESCSKFSALSQGIRATARRGPSATQVQGHCAGACPQGPCIITLFLHPRFVEAGGLGFFWEGFYSPVWFLQNSVVSALLGLTADARASILSEPSSNCEGRFYPLSHQGWKFPSYLGLSLFLISPQLVSKPILLEMTLEFIP